MQRVLNPGSPAQETFIHQLPQLNSHNFQNEPGFFILGDDYDHVYYQRNGILCNAPQTMIDLAVAEYFANRGGLILHTL